MIIKNETPLLESNNFEHFSSAENNYIKGILKLLVTETTNKLTFIKITAKCSLYIDIYDEISWNEYTELTQNLTLLSLAGNITFSLEKGWIASDWIYLGYENACSCVLSRSEYSGEIEDYTIKIENIITFGLENDTEITFEFYDENKKHLGEEMIPIYKTFDQLDQTTLKATKYTLSKTDSAKLLWSEQNIEGTNKPKSLEITPFFSENSYKRFNDENGQCIVTYMPPQIHDISFVGDKTERGVKWETAFCVKISLKTDIGEFIDVTNKREHKVDFVAQKYVHMRFQGYLYQIDKVFYNTKQCGIDSYVSELSQTIYAFEDSGIRLMRLEWKKTKNFKFFVEGTPMCSDYCIDTTNITSWEYPFQFLGEDYSAIYIFDNKPVYQLAL